MTRSESYQVLGLDADASTEQIRQAYRRRAREWHPDTNLGDSRAEERFKKLLEAYRTLTQTAPPADTVTADTNLISYLASLLRDLVRKIKQRPRRGSDLRYHLEVKHADLIAGGKFLLDLPGKKLEVRVPPGTENGARIRIEGEGDPGLYGGPPGDLILIIPRKA